MESLLQEPLSIHSLGALQTLSLRTVATSRLSPEPQCAQLHAPHRASGPSSPTLLVDPTPSTASSHQRFRTLGTATTRPESIGSPLRFRAEPGSPHGLTRPTRGCDQGRKMRRGTRAKITPVLWRGKPKVSWTNVALEWEKPRITAGPLNRNPMLGEHLLGSFGRLLGGNAGATC